MGFDLDDSINLLRRTPVAVDALVRDLPDGWLASDEGPGTWNALDVVRHLLHTEDDDWLPRTRALLEHGTSKPWPSFDPSQARANAGDRTLSELLDAFAERRTANLDAIEGMDLTDEDLERTAIHPTFGEVHLRQHLATWVAHDLDHLRQIARALALRHRDDIGPWTAFLTIMD